MVETILPCNVQHEKLMSFKPTHKSVGCQVSQHFSMGEAHERIRDLEKKLDEMTSIIRLQKRELDAGDKARKGFEEQIKILEEKLESVSQKRSKDFTQFEKDDLVKKCLQLATGSRDLLNLAQSILRSENYMEAAVINCAPRLVDQIRMHLSNKHGCRTWTRKYLLTLRNNRCFAGYKEFEKTVDHLLCLK